MNNPQLKQAKSIFKKKFRSEPQVEVYAPASASILGDHEDYNDGYVLSFALPLKLFIVGSKSHSSGTTYPGKDYSLITSETIIHTPLYDNHTSTFIISTEGLKKGNEKWCNYLKAVILEYLEDLPPGLTFNAVITSNIPTGYGLGSSAALEIAMATFLEKICDMKHRSPVTKALRCHKADISLGYKFRGISNHFTSALAVPGDLLLIDCQSKDYQLVKFIEKDPSKPPPVLVVTPCQPKQSNYQSQLSSQVHVCRDAVKTLNAIMPEITSLRSAGLEDLDVVKDQMDDVSISRAHYIITENTRTLDAVKYLSRFDYSALGLVMNQSFESLSESLEACTPQMKLLVQESLEVPGVLGSKMMGYGYGGCLITLIERHSARTLELHLKKRSQEEFKQECSCYVCPIPSGGAGDCHSPDLQTNSSLLKRYQPELLPEEKGDLLTKKLIPFVIAFGILVGIISAMVVLRREKSLED